MGFCSAPDKVRIVCMVMLGFALVTHMVAFAAPKWDSFISNPSNLPIKVTQNLWGFKDDSHVAYKLYHSVIAAIPDESKNCVYWNKLCFNARICIFPCPKMT